jgi:hypothetical protein
MRACVVLRSRVLKGRRDFWMAMANGRIGAKPVGAGDLGERPLSSRKRTVLPPIHIPLPAVSVTARKEDDPFGERDIEI